MGQIVARKSKVWVSQRPAAIEWLTEVGSASDNVPLEDARERKKGGQGDGGEKDGGGAEEVADSAEDHAAETLIEIEECEGGDDDESE